MVARNGDAASSEREEHVMGQSILCGIAGLLAAVAIVYAAAWMALALTGLLLSARESRPRTDP